MRVRLLLLSWLLVGGTEKDPHHLPPQSRMSLSQAFTKETGQITAKRKASPSQEGLTSPLYNTHPPLPLPRITSLPRLCCVCIFVCIMEGIQLGPG